MKRVLKLITRLYPLRWQRRYGSELSDLIDDRQPSTKDAFDLLRGAVKIQLTTWTFSKITFATAAACMVAAFGISGALPASYVSQSLIEVTMRDKSTGNYFDLTKDNTVDAALREQMLNVVGRKSLVPIIEENNLYPTERSRMPLDYVISRMQRSITVKPILGAGSLKAFIFEFSYSDPLVAQKVNEELVSRFMDNNVANPSPSHFAFRAFDRPSYPPNPTGLNRIQLSAIGLLVGLLTGLMLAATVRPRKKTMPLSS